MTRFCVYTRGRTGSTAIADELNKHPQITCHGEIFRPGKVDAPRMDRTEVVAVARQRGTVALYKGFTGEPAHEPFTESGIAAYLDYLDAESSTETVGWKIIAGNSGEGFLDHCHANKVRVINLRRRNIVRQVVSGMVASELEVFNKTNYTPDPNRTFKFKPDLVVQKVKRTHRAYEKQDAMLAAHAVPSIAVYYEDWRADRAKFFKQVLGFIDVEVIHIDKTNFSQMTPEPLSKLLSNYKRIAKALTKAGFGEYLDD